MCFSFRYGLLLKEAAIDQQSKVSHTHGLGLLARVPLFICLRSMPLLSYALMPINKNKVHARERETFERDPLKSFCLPLPI